MDYVQRNRANVVSQWPNYGWLGVGLISVFWFLNWTAPGLRTHLYFFPLWLGYCLTVDALVVFRSGSSLYTRSRLGYAGLFVISAAVWWLFEVLNWRTQNWFYDGREFFTDLEYFALATLSFSTVMPAVFGTAELVSTFNWTRRWKEAPVLIVSKTGTLLSFAVGWLMLFLLLTWPLYFFPLLWLSVYLITEPINVWLGNRTLFRYFAEGDWHPVLTLGLGCLICGFFWEMWNFYSYPKWIYQVPFVDFLHVFEMPLLGYGGYIPFSLELFALYHLIVGLFGHKENEEFVVVTSGRVEELASLPGKATP